MCCVKSRSRWFSLLLFSIILAASYDVHSRVEPNLRGRVLDWNGNGIPEAMVRLSIADLQVKTDLSGYFSFNSAFTVPNNVNKPEVPDIQLKGAVLQVKCKAIGIPVVLSLFTTSGKRIAVVHNSNGTGENIAIDISRWIRTAQMVIIQAVIGLEIYTIPLISLSPSRSAFSSIRHAGAQSSGFLQKTATTADVLTITRFGYNAATCILSSLDTMIDIIRLSYEFRKAADPAGMIRIPGGVFQMGSNTPGTRAYPPHTVLVSPFFMDSTELTQAEYVKMTGKEPWLKHEKAAECGVGPLYPAWYVNWSDAVHYCNQRSKKSGYDTVYTWTDVDGEP